MQTQADGQDGQGRSVAVTGITGFIGGNLAAELARRGWRMRALTRSMPRIAATAGPPIEVIPGHLHDPDALRRLVSGADAVIHMAGAIKARDRASFMRANAEGTAALAEAWRTHAPDARFLHLSSMAAREPTLSHYAASKRAAEAVLEAVPGDWCILRPAAVYGPGDRETLRIFRLAGRRRQPMLNGPDARVSLIHVADLVRAMAGLIGGETAPVQRYELTDMRPEGYSWTALVRAAAAAMDREARPVRVPAPAVRALGRLGDAVSALGGGAEMLTSQKAREILHPDWSSTAADQPHPALWRPDISLERGFSEAVKWYRARGWLR